MGPHLPDVFVSIRLYRTEDGGRKNPTLRYRHGFIFGVNGAWFEAMMFHPEPIEPGATANNVGLSFLNPDLLQDEIEVGSRFVIRELGIVGEGKIEKIINLERNLPLKAE